MFCDIRGTYRQRLETMLLAHDCLGAVGDLIEDSAAERDVDAAAIHVLDAFVVDEEGAAHLLRSPEPVDRQHMEAVFVGVASSPGVEGDAGDECLTK